MQASVLARALCMRFGLQVAPSVNDSLLFMQGACRLSNGRCHLHQLAGDNGGEQGMRQTCSFRLGEISVLPMVLIYAFHA
jgi:hypothetical protein